jgi:energy-coupling factor transporter transmembrane protein EcfT
MFSKSQLIFAALFIVVFTIAMVWSYRKDFKVIKKYYKNTFIIVIAIFLIIAIFTMITFSMH